MRHPTMDLNQTHLLPKNQSPLGRDKTGLNRSEWETESFHINRERSSVSWNYQQKGNFNFLQKSPKSKADIPKHKEQYQIYTHSQICVKVEKLRSPIADKNCTKIIPTKSLPSQRIEFKKASQDKPDNQEPPIKLNPS